MLLARCQEPLRYLRASRKFPCESVSSLALSMAGTPNAGCRNEDPKILLLPERGVRVGDAFDTDDIVPKKKAELARIRLKTPRLSLDAALLPAPRVGIFEPSYFFSSTKTRSS